jgi:hypothetical protein
MIPATSIWGRMRSKLLVASHSSEQINYVYVGLGLTPPSRKGPGPGPRPKKDEALASARSPR